MRLSQILQDAIARLATAGVETPELDAGLLLGHCLHLSRSQIFLNANEVISEEKIKEFQTLLARRQNREPLAYITGNQEFWSLDFNVSPAVLIPRPETEFMLEKVLEKKEKWQKEGCNVLDLCTGSGVIAIVLAKELNKKVDAVDLSRDALNVAVKNRNKHGLEDRIEFYHSDLFAGLPAGKKYGLIVSNPPYVRLFSIENELEPEVAQFEPRMALDGGGDLGLDLIWRMRKALPCYLHHGGEVFIEFGAEQGAHMREIFQTIGSDGSEFMDVHIYQDYAGRDRVLHATLK